MANVIQSCLETKLGLLTFFFTSMDSSESFGLNCPSWLLTRAWLEGFVGMMVLTLRYFSAGILPALNVEKKLNSQFPRLLLLPASAKYRMMCKSQRFTSLSTARLKNWEISFRFVFDLKWLRRFHRKFGEFRCSWKHNDCGTILFSVQTDRTQKSLVQSI